MCFFLQVACDSVTYWRFQIQLKSQSFSSNFGTLTVSALSKFDVSGKPEAADLLLMALINWNV